MDKYLDNILTIIITISLNIGTFLAGFFKVLPDMALFLSTIGSITISILVVRHYIKKGKVSDIEIKLKKAEVAAKELEIKKIELEIKNEELLLRKRHELKLKGDNHE